MNNSKIKNIGFLLITQIFSFFSSIYATNSEFGKTCLPIYFLWNRALNEPIMFPVLPDLPKIMETKMLKDFRNNTICFKQFAPVLHFYFFEGSSVILLHLLFTTYCPPWCANQTRKIFVGDKEVCIFFKTCLMCIRSGHQICGRTEFLFKIMI